MAESTRQALLRRAAELVGRDELAKRLKVPGDLLDVWMRGLATMPDRKTFPLADLVEELGDSEKQLRIGIDIEAADYSLFRALMPTEERLGESYAHWLQRRLEEDSRPGEPVTHVVVHPDEFGLYCLQLGQKPGYHMLEVFAATKARAR